MNARWGQQHRTRVAFMASLSRLLQDIPAVVQAGPEGVACDVLIAARGCPDWSAEQRQVAEAVAAALLVAHAKQDIAATGLPAGVAAN